MTSDRKSPGVAFWATVVLVAALVGYPLSFGPAVWVIDHDDLPAAWAVDAFEVLYRPIIWLEENGPTPISYAIDSYIELWQTGKQPEYLGRKLM